VSKNRPLPNVAKWQPREDKANTLQQLFLRRCKAIESRILMRVQNERDLNIDNFDSGPAVEEIIREELAHLLPRRYAVRAGVVLDRDGRTAGDCDVVIFNDIWFPSLKEGATSSSRRSYYPVEGTYAVLEIKQTLNFRTLDEAMRKLVQCHRLNRPRTPYNRLTENRDQSSCDHATTNPLFSAIVASGLDTNIDMDEIVERFYFINTKLKRFETIRSLCVLGQGAFTWGYWDPETHERRPALFMGRDLHEPLIPGYQKVREGESAFYQLMQTLLLHLYHSILAPEDVAVFYGDPHPRIAVPLSPEFRIDPDAEWLAALEIPCREEHIAPEP
jgi:hypothetical protein